MKSETDLHWNKRAESIDKDEDVNIIDFFQRELEYTHICPHLTSDMTVLEAGCGNGYSTNIFRSLVKHIDSFDYSEEMIKRAKSRYGEKNNTFTQDSVLNLQHIQGQYDVVVCVRLLINLRSLKEQRKALHNLSSLVKPEGLLILVEGFRDGFEALDRFRVSVGLPVIVPAKINFYSYLSDLLPVLEKHFLYVSKFHLGMYDYLTRVVYPLMVGADNAVHNTVFSQNSLLVAKQFNPQSLEPFSRVRGFVLQKSAKEGK